MLAQTLGEAKDRGVFLYYASLPISKANLLVAMMASKLLLQIPGILAALVGGSLIYGFPLNPNPVLLLIIPLSALSLSGIGAAFGLLSPSYQLTNGLSQLVLFIVMFAAPVLIPPDALPAPLQWFGWLLPPTYAADAIRRAVAGINDSRLALDLIVLGGCAVASLFGMSRGLRWRLG
jgi:ABC-2 type transport system permease protein